MKDAKIVVAKAIPHRRGEPRCIAGFATDMDIPEVSAGRTAEHAEMGLQGLPGWQERDEGPGCRPGRGNGRAHQLAMNTQGKLGWGSQGVREQTVFPNVELEPERGEEVPGITGELCRGLANTQDEADE